MQPDHITQWDSKKTVRIVITEIVLCGKGEFNQVIQGSYILRFETNFLKSMSIKGNFLINPLYCCTQAFLLKGLQSLRLTEVIAVQIPDHPGGLAEVLALMQEAGINIEYLYAFVAKVSGDALAVFRVENSRVAEQLMLGKGIKVLSGEDVYNL